MSASDVVYIGLAGGNADAEGTFEQRIRSHAAKLQRGDVEAGCPRAWANYHRVNGGIESLQFHALRLILMPARTLEDKASIKRLEDFLLLVWRATCDQGVPELPQLNTRRPDLAAVMAFFEGPVEDEVAHANLALNAAPELFVRPEEFDDGEAPVDIVEEIWPNEDEALEQAERLEQYHHFFAARGYEPTWNSIIASVTHRGLSLRVIAMRNLIRGGRPGELRVASMLAGGQRAQQVHAIFIPELDGHYTRVELRLPVAQLPNQLALLAEPFTRGKMQSKLRLPTERIGEVIDLFP